MKNDFWPEIIHNYTDTDNITHRIRNLKWKDFDSSHCNERFKQILNHFYGNSLYGAFIKEVKYKEDETNEKV